MYLGRWRKEPITFSVGDTVGISTALGRENQGVKSGGGQRPEVGS